MRRQPHGDPPEPKRNRILRALSEDDYHAIIARAEIVSLDIGTYLCRNNQPIDAVYFPLNSLSSMLIGAQQEEQVEMGTVGSEGLVGAVAVLQVERAVGLQLVQIPGQLLLSHAVANPCLWRM